jgi:biotin carboxyl carrier protein
MMRSNTNARTPFRRYTPPAAPAAAPKSEPAAAPAPVAAAPAAPAAKAAGEGQTVTSPLPGVIIEVSVKEGQAVKAGQKVAVIEAMKMENEIQAPADGTVTAVLVGKGDSVLEGAPVVKIA